MDIYDIAVIGGGAAGTMAAIRAGQLNKNTILIERNASIGVKILMTGAGRCNITNIAPIDVFVEKFGRQGEFLRSAFYKFSNTALIDFFESNGLKLKSERQGRVFPSTDKASSVVETLKKCIKESGAGILYKMELAGVKKKDGLFEALLNGGGKISAKRIILATGGVSYPATGSKGEGLYIAKKLGHTVIPLKAALVPLRTKETWVKQLQGVSLDNIRITFLSEGKKIISGIGELMFTHFGVSGPLVLDLSGNIVALTSAHKEVKLFIDLKPGLDAAKLETRLLNDLSEKGSSQLSTIMEGLLPKKMVPVFIRVAGLNPVRKASQITQAERQLILKLLKALPLTIEGALSIEKGMVTNGGISTKEINPRTMGSKIISGLYFAGEIIDGAAPSGGYNLQQAFSTGFLAGEAAANA
ncbi:MAG: NAD(P)/FAD-dependent oxidoreductase [Candidatus Omnitrophica bacterium]|nr:NAD(P)/FAD-dependent oxidoreductase [Candidatus Omnitrophota bacterium]